MRTHLEHPGQWAKLVTDVENNGQPMTSRNGDVTEVLGAQIVVDRPGYVVPRGARKGINYGIGAVEACQLVAGEEYPELQTRVAKKMKDFQDGQVFHGSYGPRIAPQMPYILELLQSVPDTRQAVATVWDPMYDQQSRKDLPCTTQFQWFVRNGQLHQVVTMRSNDVVWGTVYDLFQFGWLQRVVAHCVGWQPGRLYVNVGSLHIYDATAPQVVNVCTWNHVRMSSPELPNHTTGEMSYAKDAVGVWKMWRDRHRIVLDAAMERQHTGGQTMDWFTRNML